MFDISVPIINITAEEMGLEKYIDMLKRLNAKRVVLAIDKCFLSDTRKAKELSALKRNCAFFHEHGFEVGAWLFLSVNCKRIELRIKNHDGNVG